MRVFLQENSEFRKARLLHEPARESASFWFGLPEQFLIVVAWPLENGTIALALSAQLCGHVAQFGDCLRNAASYSQDKEMSFIINNFIWN